MSDDDFGLDDLVDDAPAPPAASNGHAADPDLRAAAALAAQHPDFAHPGPDYNDGDVPDYYEDPDAIPPLELLRFDRLPEEQPPEAGLLFRPDGRGLFYMAAVNSIAGDPGVGKTFAALLAALAALAAGYDVTLLDYEDTPGRLRARLTALGVTQEQLAHVHGVKDLDRLHPQHVDQLIEHTHDLNVGVIVIDAVTEALESHDLDENSGGDYSRWHRTVPMRLARAGPAVILIDHRPKPSQSVRGMTTRGLWAVATRQKLAGVDLAYVLEARDPFSRADPGRTGRLDLIVAKDKHGSIGGRGDIVARFELTPQTTGAVDHAIGIPPATGYGVDDEGERLTGIDRLMGRRHDILPLIHELWERDLAKDPQLVGLSTNRIAGYLRTLPIEKRLENFKLEGRDNAIRDALRAWADSGYLTHFLGPRRANLWRPVDAELVDLFHPASDPLPNIDPDTGLELDF